MLNDIIHLLQAMLALFLFGVIIDYPEQKRKKRYRQLEKQKKDCERGNHVFSFWEYERTIGYNDKDIYHRHCKHCQYKQFTISRLHPLDDEVITYDKI